MNWGLLGVCVAVFVTCCVVSIALSVWAARRMDRWNS
jgi:hypothetical protein